LLFLVRAPLNADRYQSKSCYQPLCPVVPSLNTNSTKWEVVKAVVASGLYPQLLRLADKRDHWVEADHPHNATHVEAHFPHPSASLFHLCSFPVKDKLNSFYTYHTKLKTSKVFVRDLTQLPNIAVLLFGGQPAIKHSSKRVDIPTVSSRSIEVRCVAKTAVILSRIREELVS
jgi:hypothetical protein